MPLKKPLSTPVLNIICPSLFHRFTSGKKTGGGGEADHPACYEFPALQGESG